MLCYAPKEMSMWDAWFVEDRDWVHAFHLQKLAKQSSQAPGSADWIGHARSRDLVRWEQLPSALGPGAAGGDDDMQPWTGCVVAHEGTYYLYYTMRSTASRGMKQRIGLATSADLMTWRRHGGNPIIEPDERWYVGYGKPLDCGVVDCRDLVVVRDGDRWLGFYATMRPAAEFSEMGTIACVESHDLIHWTHLPPAFAPGRYSVLEVPDVFELDGAWYMTCLAGHRYGNRGFFSDPNVGHGTIYAVSDRPEGPYLENHTDNVLIGSTVTGYSCRSIVYEGQRHLLYIQPGTDHDTLSPPMLVKAPSPGKLRLGWSDRQETFRKQSLVPSDGGGQVRLLAATSNWLQPSGTWTCSKGTYRGRCHTGWQVVEVGAGAALLEVEVTVDLQDAFAAGIVFRCDCSRPYCSPTDLAFLAEPGSQTVRATSLPVFGDPVVRVCALRPGSRVSLRLIVREEWFELYVDNILLLESFLEKPPAVSPGIGLLVDRGNATFSNLHAFQLG